MMNKKSKNKKLRRKLSFVLLVAAVGVLMMRAMPGMSGKIAKIAERRQEQTAVTAWIISALGFKVDIAAFALPLLAFGIL